MKKIYNSINGKLVVCVLLLMTGRLYSIAQTALPAPTNLSATSPSYNEVLLKWTDNSAELETGFEIFRDPGLGNNYQLIATTAKNISSYSDKTVAANTLYNYRVRAINARQQSQPSNDISVTTQIAPPVAPGNLSATLVNNTTIRLSWDGNNSGGTSFYVERMNRSAGGTYTQIAVVEYSRTLVFDNTGLSAGTEYCYRVRAHNTSGESGYSNESCASTPQVTPAAPGRLSAIAISSTQIDLSWADISDNETGFEVERGSTENGTFTMIADLGPNASTYSNQNLSPQTAYCYRVRAKNAAGNSGYAGPVCATTKVPIITIPRPPGSLTASATSPSQINLSWADNADNEDGFELERSLDGNSFAKIADIGSNTTTFQNVGLNPSTKYYYRIRSKNSAGFSDYSNIADATTSAPAVTIPRPPGGLAASAVLSSQINLSWADNSDNEDGFELERSLDGNSFAKIADVGSNTTTFQNVGLNPSTKYYYRIRSKNSAGFSDYSNVADATTSAPAVTIPRPPGGLTASAVSSSQINLSWADNSDNEDGFELERSLDGNSFSKIADIGSNTTTFQNVGLNPSAKYYYRIRSKNSAGFSDYSNVTDATTGEVAPDAPQRLVAIAVSTSQINLSWADISSNETGFELERSADGTNFTKLTDLPANTTTYENIGLSTFTRYWYRVRTRNQVGTSGYSNITDATTFDIPPTAPTELTASSVSSSQINLSWKDLSANETGFEIERTTDGTNFVKIADVGANVSTYQNTALSPATRYYFRVRAVNSASPSAYSNVADATTADVVPAAPARLTANAVSYQQIDLSWADISGNETGFEVERSADGNSFTKIADLTANTVSYQDKTVLALTKYFYRVRAANKIGFSTYSNTAEAATPRAPIPDKPQNLVATPVDFDLIQLNWAALSENATDVIIERSSKPDADFVQIGSQNASIIQFPDHEILDVNDYYYRVKAVNAAGSSPYSDVAKVPASAIITGSEPVAGENLIYAFDKILFVKTAKPGKYRISLFDLQGKKIQELWMNQTIQTNLSVLSCGIYIVVVQSDKQLFSQKIVLF